MNQRSVNGSTHTSAITPNGKAIAPPTDTQATSRGLHCGMACKANGRLHMLSISSSVGAAMVGPYTADISGM